MSDKLSAEIISKTGFNSVLDFDFQSHNQNLPMKYLSYPNMHHRIQLIFPDYFFFVDPFQMEGKNENGRVASHETAAIHFKTMLCICIHTIVSCTGPNVHTRIQNK